MISRAGAATKLVELFDSPILRAFLEPSRLEVLRVVMVRGEADIATIADDLPQDRSVISRHLKVLQDAQIVTRRRDGRRAVYEINGMHFLDELQGIVDEAKALVPQCCPPRVE
ncbi:MAG: ArsR/SmtB family transcription factor [Nannocystales bacterium]